MWSVHTSANMEKAGIPTATIATDGMAAMGQQTGKELGFDYLPIVTIPHPSDRLTESQVQKAAESIVDEIVYILTEPAKKIEKEYRNKYSWSNIRKSEMFVSTQTCPITKI